MRQKLGQNTMIMLECEYKSYVEAQLKEAIIIIYIF